MGKYGVLESIFLKETEKYEKLRQLYESREELYKNACVKVVDADPELQERAGRYVDMILTDQLKAFGGVDEIADAEEAAMEASLEDAKSDELTIEDVPEIDDIAMIDSDIPATLPDAIDENMAMPDPEVSEPVMPTLETETSR